jgi:cell division FtsZ-interacting protein ZapD
MSSKKRAQGPHKNLKGSSKKKVNVRNLLGEACKVAGDISEICRKKTSAGELLNQNELSNLKVATEILRTTRESQLRAKALKQMEDERKQIKELQMQPQPVQLDSTTITQLLESMKKPASVVVDAE